MSGGGFGRAKFAKGTERSVPFRCNPLIALVRKTAQTKGSIQAVPFVPSSRPLRPVANSGCPFVGLPSLDIRTQLATASRCPLRPPSRFAKGTQRSVAFLLNRLSAVANNTIPLSGLVGRSPERGISLDRARSQRSKYSRPCRRQPGHRPCPLPSYSPDRRRSDSSDPRSVV